MSAPCPVSIRHSLTATFKRAVFYANKRSVRQATGYSEAKFSAVLYYIVVRLFAECEISLDNMLWNDDDGRTKEDDGKHLDDGKSSSVKKKFPLPMGFLPTGRYPFLP